MVQLEMRVPALETHNFGVGVQRLSGSVRGLAVKPEDKAGPAQGGDLYFEVSRVSTMRDLQTALGISVEASYGAFGAGISGRFSFMETSKLHQSSLFMSVVATVTHASRSITDCELTDDASRQVDNPEIFATRYGDMFCRAVRTGGIFLGLLQVETVDSSQAREIEAKLKGSYGFFSAAAEAKFSEVLSNEDLRSYFRIYQEGGPAPVIRDPNNPLELLGHASAWLQALGSQTSTWGKAYEWTLAPMEIAEGPLPPNGADLQHAQDVLLFCASERLDLLEDLHDLQWHLDRQEIFDWDNRLSVESKLSTRLLAFNRTLALSQRPRAMPSIIPVARRSPRHGRAAKFLLFPIGPPPCRLPCLQCSRTSNTAPLLTSEVCGSKA